MKRIVLAMVVATMATPAFAWDWFGSDEDRRMENDNYTRAEQVFNRLDADNNGILNVRESQALGEKSYRVDKNNDQQITLAELSHDMSINSAQNWNEWGYSNQQAREQRTVR